MIDVLIKSTKESIIERLANPLLGSFVVAWCLWNYKFLVILFSAASVTQTFKLVEHVAFPDTSSVVLQGILFPLVTALLYVFVYPYPARFIYAFTLRRQREVNAVKRRIEDETLLTLEASRAIRAEYVQVGRKHQETVDRLNEEISHLKAELDQIQKTALSGQKLEPAERFFGAIEPTQLTLLQELEQCGGVAMERRLLARFPGSKTKAEFDLGELLQRGLVEKRYDSSDGSYEYQFTHDGRRVLLNGGKLGA